ncbi:hypothetical protein EKD04_022130 [Chloroflexales bacterium ZM16-3]|nr:hypothetical protein [Chloroflexales bacterium ZM16-3]
MESYTPPAGGFTPSATTMAPPAPAPRPSSSDASASPVTPSVQFDGPIQPITFLVRAFARGVLPPQGLDAFTKELGATSTDVWNMYTHWARFQTEDVFRFGREMITTISNALPAGNPQMSQSRRIKVTVADGNVVPISSVATDDPKPATGADKAKS